MSVAIFQRIAQKEFVFPANAIKVLNSVKTF